MTRRRTNAGTAFGIVLSLLVVLGLGVVVAPPAEARGGPPVPSLDWRPCGDDVPGKLCATARVPLDYDEPRGRTTELALAKVPASDPARRIGTLFINPGGPGSSGVGLLLSGFGDYMAENLDGRFDVVGFDPRGVAGSDPLHCFDSEDDLNAFFAGQPVFPYRRAQERPYFAHFRSLAAECLDDRRSVARHMSTADVARDLDLLRRAVGDSRLTYFGVSYGSYIGNTYANLFPGRVRALVIDGVLEPRLYSSGWLIKIDRTGAQEVLDEALRLCDVAGSACAFGAPGGSRARWEALADRIRREPVVLDDGFTYTYDLLIADAAGVMSAPEDWPDYMGFLDQVADAALGSRHPVTASAAARTRILGPLEQPGADADYGNGLDAFYGNLCADVEFPKSFQTYRAVGRYAESGSRIGPRWWWFFAGCADWPTAPDRYVGPWTARTSAPVLVVGNRYDAITDYAGAQASARLLPNSRLLTYAGWGHTAYGRSDCITAHVHRYLLTGTTPPEGTVCPANPNPFTTVSDRRERSQRVPVALPPSAQLVSRR